jgi:hypothetical protein
MIVVYNLLKIYFRPPSTIFSYYIVKNKNLTGLSRKDRRQLVFFHIRVKTIAINGQQDGQVRGVPQNSRNL